MRIPRIQYITVLYHFFMFFVFVFTIGCGTSSGTKFSDTAPSFDMDSSQRVNEARKSMGKNRLTIMLAQYREPNRIELAQSLQRRAERLLRSNDVWLQNEPLGLTVNYGHFETEAQARKEHEQVKNIYKELQPGSWQFSYIKELPEPDPPAPAQWNLLNNECDYSLEIGTYYDIPEKNYYDRKTDAVKAVKALRESGETAFFVHGRTESRVYLGCIPYYRIQQTLENGRAKTQFSPLVKALQARHPYRLEHGAKVNAIERDATGRNIRIPRKSVFVNVEMLRREKMY